MHWGESWKVIIFCSLLMKEDCLGKIHIIVFFYQIYLVGTDLCAGMI